MPIHHRRQQDRGFFNHGWLKTHHTFSFADYFDRKFMGFSELRVMNEDIVECGKGFDLHPHRDMEVLSYILSGEITHGDSMGNHAAKTQAGQFQIMSAGTGIWHSEHNTHKTDQLHFYQIWIKPAMKDLPPRYESQTFADKTNEGMQLIVSPDAREGSLKVFNDVCVYRGLIKSEQRNLIPADRCVWIQVVKGHVLVNDVPTSSSDGVAIWDEPEISLSSDDTQPAEVLYFDLPKTDDIWHRQSV